MILDRVTLTGADDSVDPVDVVRLAEKYPYSEWGLLFIHPSQGQASKRGDGSRWPSFEWIAEFLEAAPASLNLCAHLCGPYVDTLLERGKYVFGRTKAFDPMRFQRVQLNFHGFPYDPYLGDSMLPIFKGLGQRFIFQCDGVNDTLVKQWAEAERGFPLFDTSGGAGVLPGEVEEGSGWPTLWPGIYCGYAGGLGPTNVVGETTGPIAQAAGDGRIWIDMETRVRSNHDRLFDLAKCEEVLKAMEPHVTQA